MQAPRPAARLSRESHFCGFHRERNRISMTGEARLARLTAAAVSSLGSNDFYDRLLDLVGAVAPHDLAALVRYARSGPPDMILPRIEPSAAMQSYTRHFYTYDPFHVHWTERAETGVFTLRGLDPSVGRSRYAREFLSAMAIHDEIAVFLPPLGDAAPTLILDRANSRFTQQEVMRVRGIFPLLAALQRRHLGLFVSTGVDLIDSPIGHERPLRIIDQHGHPIYATRAWTGRLTQSDRELANVLELLADRGPCLTTLNNGEALRRTRLPADFGTAPSGYCDEIIPTRREMELDFDRDLPGDLAKKLTPREQEVVRLTLRGFPVIEIARRMGLSRGTVKNYRLAIYRKLDITSERELFGEFLRALGTSSG